MDTAQITEEFNSLIESISRIAINEEVKETIEGLKNSINDSLNRIDTKANVINATIAKLDKSQAASASEITNHLNWIYDNILMQNEQLKKRLSWLLSIVSIILLTIAVVIMVYLNNMSY